MQIFRARAAAAWMALAVGLASGAALAHEYTVGGLKIGHPWTRATAPDAKVAAGFLTVTNTGSAPDKLISATFAGADHVLIHQMTMDGGVMKMTEVPGGIEIKPGQTVELKPGGYHLMLMALKGGMKMGETVKGELVFEKAGKIAVEFDVQDIGSTAPMQHTMPMKK